MWGVLQIYWVTTGMILGEINEISDQEGTDGIARRRRTLMKLVHLQLWQARQVLHKAAKLRHASTIAAERKGMLVPNALTRIESGKKFGIFGNPTYICRLRNRVNKMTSSKTLVLVKMGKLCTSIKRQLYQDLARSILTRTTLQTSSDCQIWMRSSGLSAALKGYTNTRYPRYKRKIWRNLK